MIDKKFITPSVITVLVLLATLYVRLESHPAILAVIGAGLVVLFSWESWNRSPVMREIVSRWARGQFRGGALEAKADLVTKFSSQPEQLVFGYGSLLSPRSLLRTLIRSGDRVEYVPAQLKGYKLTWGSPVPRLNMMTENWESAEDVDLGSFIAQAGERSDHVDGALISVTEDELYRLRLREKHYELQEVTSNIHCGAADHRAESGNHFAPWPTGLLRGCRGFPRHSSGSESCPTT